VLAYAGRDGRIAAVDVDTGKALWRTAQASVPVAFAWTEGKRLAVLDERQLRLFEGGGDLLRTSPLPEGAVGQALASRPGTPELAYSFLSPATGESGVILYDVRTGNARLLFAGAGPLDNLVWSPDGEILLVAWPAAGEFVFLRIGEGDASVVAPGVEVGEGPESFPRVDGWCCSVVGA
jgi:WD40 repeat protein